LRARYFFFHTHTTLVYFKRFVHVRREVALDVKLRFSLKSNLGVAEEARSARLLPALLAATSAAREKEA
jgi:hypothetical protein